MKLSVRFLTILITTLFVGNLVVLSVGNTKPTDAISSDVTCADDSNRCPTPPITPSTCSVPEITNRQATWSNDEKTIKLSWELSPSNQKLVNHLEVWRISDGALDPAHPELYYLQLLADNLTPSASTLIYNVPTTPLPYYRFLVRAVVSEQPVCHNQWAFQAPPLCHVPDVINRRANWSDDYKTIKLTWEMNSASERNLNHFEIWRISNGTLDPSRPELYYLEKLADNLPTTTRSFNYRIPPVSLSYYRFLIRAVVSETPVCHNQWALAPMVVPTPPYIGTIGDTVWSDANRNGVQDSTETKGVAKVKVTLYSSNPYLERVDFVYDSTYTDEFGRYTFNNVGPGRYAIGFTLPRGYVFSPQNSIRQDCFDSDPDISTGMTESFDFKGGINLCWDAGMYKIDPQPTATPTPTLTPTPSSTPTPTLTPNPTILPSRVSYDIQKKVRKAGTNDSWVENLGIVKAGDEVEFQITVKNTGTVNLHELKVVDVLPQYLKLTSAANQWTINNLAPNQEMILTLTAKVNIDGLSVNEEKRVVNVVNLVYQNETKDSDTAELVVKRLPGQVLGDQLPDTGLFDNNRFVLGIFVVLIISGLLLTNISRIAQLKLDR